MRKPGWVDWTAIGAILLLTALYTWTLKDVPFHPDESTHIYMSKDISQNPLDLAWDGELPLSNQERIRAIDAPLSRYLIGAVRGIFSVQPLPADWNWSLSWEDNLSQGALPSDRQLLFSRGVMTLLLPLSLWFFYLALQKILPNIPALAAVLLLGLNPLMLLHARRAMSESPLILGITFFLWAVTREKRNPWLIGLAVGLAVNAKHSAVGLVPAALLAIIFLPEGFPGIKESIINILKTAVLLFFTLALLNPFYWKHPLDALDTGIKARISLASDQQEDYLSQFNLDEQKFRITLPALILNTYLNPPQTEEVGNYLVETELERETYLTNPFHNWGRDKISGSILAALSLVGLGTAFWRFKDRTPPEKNNLVILSLGTLGIGAFLILLLPWQRYILAMLPFTFSWVGFGLAPIIKAVQKTASR